MKKWDESLSDYRRRIFTARNLDCTFYLTCLELAADEDSPGLPCGDCPKIDDTGGRISVDNFQEPEFYGAVALMTAIFFEKEINEDP